MPCVMCASEMIESILACVRPSDRPKRPRSPFPLPNGLGNRFQRQRVVSQPGCYLTRPYRATALLYHHRWPGRRSPNPGSALRCPSTYLLHPPLPSTMQDLCSPARLRRLWPARYQAVTNPTLMSSRTSIHSPISTGSGRAEIYFFLIRGGRGRQVKVYI